jgi:anhydro-N-acetylmuramic acid kinase
MVYRAIGIMSGSSLDGLDLVFTEFQETAGKWNFEVKASACIEYDEWKSKLASAKDLSARDYQLLHIEFGHFLGGQVNEFIQKNSLDYQVQLVSSHGHTVFHQPAQKMTAQVGDGASIAAITGLHVVSDLRSLDVAFGGEGAPIVPMGEKLLLQDYNYFLNLGGIANISANIEKYIAFDVCPANRVLNLLANIDGKEFDEDGKLAASGKIVRELLSELNSLPYYQRGFPKSLENEFGTGIIFPMLSKYGLSIPDALRTYVEHIAMQIDHAFVRINGLPGRLLITGGGAFNHFLIARISETLKPSGIEVIIPDETLVKFKEAIIIAFMGILRWRQENNVIASVTGAKQDSIGGALWNGTEG